jgi:peroxiredoxin Q/BCP
MLDDGDAAPDFELATDRGDTLRLSALNGAPVVLFFYPKDDTPGCTAEAKEFSSLQAAFEKAGAKIVGISPDSVVSHCKFREQHGLTVTLAADEAKETSKAYGVWVEKSMYGKKYMGVERSTFLIGRNGRIERSWRKVKVSGHAAEVLSAVRTLEG